ncbi:MAG: hypothetical protein A2V45_07085 [Candidatus Aminicenantes bacterium RBG_19FT_COMBO_58_17]|nr:MAG: hypothetical protein A2V45_07085 [Candidatus Aminicenantes bacterium RBG_19FT_COMBO_58_17]HCS47048.1 hypothetical protein [Candidatus Aminicenantes bacterium]
MICVSLRSGSCQECLKALESLDFAELRLDLMKITLADIPILARSGKRLMATCRPGPYSDALRKALLLECIRCGMDLVDVEADADEEFKTDIIGEARRRGSSVIISHHDDDQTPTRPELEAIIARSLEAGADFVKIACRANSASDSARLIGLLDRPQCQGRLIVVGMGVFGSITRVLAPFLGSPFTYASLEEGYETAPGQIGYRDLARIHRDLRGILGE